MQPQSESAKIDEYVWPLPQTVEAQERTEAVVLTEELTEAEEKARTHARTRARSQAQAKAMALGEALGEAEGWAEVEWRARVEGRARARARALMRALALARTLAQTLTQTRGPAQAPEAMKPGITYVEVLEDSRLKDIIYSLKPDHRQRLVHHLCSRSHNITEYWWLVQIIAPVTRLPREVLHQTLHILIDNASQSPLVLMRVCKHWYLQVASIWGSLKLGTRTPIDAIQVTLERRQWLLDVLFDTEIDRGHVTPSEGAYQAIFAAIQATDRWRSFLVETFPPQADLPEHVVDRHLQRCSNAVMSRLRTFKIKCACKMSPLLERLLRIIGTSASGELMTVEIKSPSVLSFLAPTYPSLFHSVRVLVLDTPGLPNPVDFLPHLHQL